MIKSIVPSSSGWPGVTYSASGRPSTAIEVLLEGDPLVPAQERRAEPDLAVAAAKLGRDVGDLEPARLPLADRAAEQAERFEEERADEVRLQLAGLGALHLVADPLDVGHGHHVAHERALVDDLAQRIAHSGVDDRVSRALTSGCSP